jgi:tripartite-type tricarboxylate transporter receptor subunit TctC
MKMTRRSLLLLSALCLAFAGMPAGAQEKYPSKPIRILVPYAPGGATDIITRLVGEQLRQSLGQQIVVENKPGAFGIPAIEEMARARPDGHTLMIGNVSTNAITPVLFAKKMSINYEREVVSVNRLATLPSFLIVTTKNFAPKSVPELIAHAKANPGKVAYGSAGVGSFPHFDMEVFARKAGISMNHIPIKAGAAGMINDLVNGDLQTAFLNVTSPASHIRAGTLKPIAVLATKRLDEHPDVPTLAEAGYPGVGTLHWQSLLAPAGTPKEVIATLHKATTEALKSPQVQEAFKKQIISATPSASPEEAQTWLKSELESWRKLVSEIKIEMTE